MVSVTELWHTLEHAITSYTGLSVATFFTVLAVAVAFYYVVSGFFQAPPPPRNREMEFEKMEPLPPPVQLGEVTEEELGAYDGSDPKKPLLMAIKGQIYDVTQSRMFYGPGGPYALFAGKDASRALAKMSFEQKDLTGDISGLGPFELEALQDWEYKFMSKYVKVGTVKKTVPVTDGNTSETTEAGTVKKTVPVTDGNTSETTEAGTVKKTVPVTDGNTSETTEASTQTTEVGPAEITAEHSAKTEEDAPAAHVNSEEDTSAGHGGEETHIPELKEVGIAEDTKE